MDPRRRFDNRKRAGDGGLSEDFTSDVMWKLNELQGCPEDRLMSRHNQEVAERNMNLGDHPKPANGDHLKTGQRKS